MATSSKSQVATKPEDQLNDPIRALLKACGDLWNREVDSRQQVKAEGIGWPDLGVTTKGLLCGHVELKAPGLGARPENFKGQNREQWKRYQALPNLIYTDGSEWSLFHGAKRAQRVRIADDVGDGAGSLSHDRVPELRKLLYEFLNWEPITPKNARGLAEFLAPLARFLRDEVTDALERGSPKLQQLATDWRGILFPEADDEQFADAFTQTLTYALLLARFEGAVNVRRAFAVETLRETEHDLLATALDLLETARGELSMPFELLERAIGVVNAPDLLRDPQMPLLPDVVRPTTDNDPWLYFYEDFLAAYDPKLRKNRGVYYTPVPVVKAQVRFASELLRDRFVKRDGFADSSVVVLDPACGTGAYPLAVIDEVKATVRKSQGHGMVAERLRNLATRLHAFELLVGPYSVAHLRIAQQFLAEEVEDPNPLVYLADTLESPDTPPTFPDSAFYAPLTKERERAQRVKLDTRVLVCLGNPPYDREQHEADEEEGRYKGGWVRYGDDSDQAPILEDFLKPVREAGGGVHLKNLYNDYVYFWRWALWKVFDSTSDGGIVSFITASSYLGGPGFGGMRKKMREVFDDLWIIDLEGGSLGARKTDNVFSIQTPVAIAIGVRGGGPNPGRPARVWKTRITGTEEQKLQALDAANTLSDLSWRECQTGWEAPFFPAEAGTYFDWPTVTDVFPWQHSGSQLKRTWPIGETRRVLESRWRRLVSLPSAERAKAFRETRDRKVKRQYRSLLGGGLEPAIADLTPDAPVPTIKQYAYRSFDRQWVIAATSLADFCRPDLWRAHGDQQIYMTSLLTNVLGTGPAAVAASDIPDLDHFRGSFGAKHAIPLYRDSQATEPNVTGSLLDVLGRAHDEPVSAESLFAYAYGVLAQPAYVERYWDELEQWPPHLPITKDQTLFARVADLGQRLLHLHTYGERFANPDRDGLPQGQARCTKAVSTAQYPERFTYDDKNSVLRIGEGEHAGEFAPVSPEVWDYSVSGMQIVKSWLDRRKEVRSGRKSSPLDDIRPERWEFGEELLELLWVLEHTIALQPEGAALLDEVCASPLFTADELPTPTDAERKPPKVEPGEQMALP